MKKQLKKTKYRVKLIYNFIFINNRKLFTLKIIIMSAYYRFLVKYLPKEHLELKMGIRNTESSKDENIDNLRVAYDVGRRIDRVCDKTYWESKCLIKALTAQRILYKKDIKTTMYLGLMREDTELKAHAWLRCGQLYVTGGNGEGYSIVAKFSK